MAKRSCRRTADENRMHEKAVKMRKMTDEQLMCYVQDRVEKARSEGFNRGRAKPAFTKAGIQSIIDEIGGITGIGETKLRVISRILERRLAGDENARLKKTDNRQTKQSFGGNVRTLAVTGV